MPNQLINQKSPYLLQHASNPVPWQAWGDGAIEQARGRDVPLLVSVGYSSCYWCHVMERESFEDADIARLMGERFVCVKVDREQRPDLDAIWMSACQVYTAITEGRSSGGWPLHVFLEPASLRPFFAGTYFPPTPAHGRMSFPQLLMGISKAWLDNRPQLLEQARELARLVEHEVQLPPRLVELDARLEQTAVRSLLAMSDHVHGGFGGAPKFPQPSIGLFLQLVAGDQAGDALKRTLEGMCLGGVRDQLDGGFHRYAVDATWTVPHFEKMLYDQGQLLLLYARQAGDDLFEQVARELAEFLIGVMRLPSGGFMASIDAEVDGREGLNYIWSRRELTRALERAGLGESCALAVDAFGLDSPPNFRDPHHPEDEPKHVLTLRARPLELAGKAGIEPRQWVSTFNKVREALLLERSNRPSPRTDTTLIASWNGLAIEGLAEAGRLLNQPRWIDAAARAAEDVLAQLGTFPKESSPLATENKRNKNAGRMIDKNLDTGASQRFSLARSAKDGVTSGPGFLEDYACFASGALALARATNDPVWLERAAAIAHSAHGQFWSDDSGWVEAPANDRGRIMAIGGIDDGAVPSGAGVISQCLVELARLTNDPIWAERAFAGLERASGAMARKPTSAMRSFMAAHSLRELMPQRVPGRDALERLSMELVSMDRSFQRFELRMDFGKGHFVSGQGGIGITPGDEGVELDCAYPKPTIRADGSECHQGRVVVNIGVRSPTCAPRPLRLAVRLQLCSGDACLPPREWRIEG